MKIKYRKQAVKYIETLDKPTKQRLRDGIEGLTKNPPVGDIRPLKGDTIESSRLRIGKYRIIFRRENDTVYIDKVDSRGDIYK